MNLWHDVPLGDDTPNEINVIIEIPKGSHNKYEIDKETSLVKLDRANYNGAPYPCEYGFIPQTLAEDGDAMDILLLATYPLVPGVLVTMRPVALMEMTDDGESDNKIIGVPVDDRRWDDVQDLDDINKHTLKEFQNFFETIKQLKAKPAVVTIHGFKGKAEAFEEIAKGQKL
ncbi:MAG: inorganic diphosphatase, partial [bacterium]|nr:inorganic diphosphatase [bacterium]